MNVWERFNETPLPEEEDVYSHLNMIDIIDAGYTQVKRVCKVFYRKKLGEYHDLYAHSDTLLLADGFENF